MGGIAKNIARKAFIYSSILYVGFIIDLKISFLWGQGGGSVQFGIHST